jgi:hypothetical protein
MRNILFLFLLSFSSFSVAQKLPAYHLFLFDVLQGEDKYSLGKAQWLNQFNPNGYNNQPYFMSDDELYVTVQMPWDTTQTDIYALNLSKLTFEPVTNTPESEYSAKRIPNSNEFSVVRVDADTAKTQRLWRYPISRNGKGKEVLKYYQSVGYYHWCSPESVLMFMVGKPSNYMQLTKLGSENTTRFPYEPGRCFLANGNQVSYVEKTNEDDWLLKKINPETLSSEIIIPTLNHSEDFALMPDGTYLMGKGSGLYQFRPKKDADWVQIAELKGYGIKKIERLVVNNIGKLVMVTK